MQSDDSAPHLAGVRAGVTLQTDAEKREMAARFAASITDEGRDGIVEQILDPRRYRMYPSLNATLSDGREITTGVRDLSFAAPRDGIAAIVHRYRGPKLSDDSAEHELLLRETHHVSYRDLVDRVNQLLGRDPELHTPHHLGWGNLIRAFDEAGLQVAESDLIALPPALDLSMRSRRRFARDDGPDAARVDLTR